VSSLDCYRCPPVGRQRPTRRSGRPYWRSRHWHDQRAGSKRGTESTVGCRGLRSRGRRMASADSWQGDSMKEEQVWTFVSCPCVKRRKRTAKPQLRWICLVSALRYCSSRVHSATRTVPLMYTYSRCTTPCHHNDAPKVSPPRCSFRTDTSTFFRVFYSALLPQRPHTPQQTSTVFLLCLGTSITTAHSSPPPLSPRRPCLDGDSLSSDRCEAAAT
jgi:hypothetical protein